MTDGPLERLAAVVAKKDIVEGGHRHGAWGAMFVVWGATVARDHNACGTIDRGPMDDFTAGASNVPAVICPVHGRIEGPEMPS